MAYYRYYPWLFDNYNSWQKTVSDPTYHDNMFFSDFVTLYKSYRYGQLPKINTARTQSTNICPPVLKEESKILSQEEVDNLILQMLHK